MHAENEGQTSSKDKSKMDINKTRKKVSDYFIYILVIAIIIQLVLLVYRLAQL